MMFKRIATKGRKNGFWFFNCYYTDGVKLVDTNFKPVTKIEGNITSEKEMTFEEIHSMIDEYAWAIDNYEQELKAEAKNRNIRLFLGEEA